MLELKELQNFVAVAERLSVSGAAKVVHLSQPALSRQIQALERKLGVKLFERIGKRLVLTAEGDDLLMHSAQLLDQAQALINRAYGLEHGHVGLLRIGASPQTISGLLSPVMTEFARLYPNVNLVISEAHNDALVELVENGGVHMAVASRTNTCNLVGRELFKAELFAVLPEKHPARGASKIDIRELADDRFLVLRRGFLTRQLFDHACAGIGIRPRIMLESDSTHTLIKLARDGHGIAVVSSSAREVHHLDNSAALISAGQTISDMVFALWHPNRYRPASLPAFVDLLEVHADFRGKGLTPVP
ncbi:LysR family transcriptional regulator [Nitratireductor aquimarinus]|nr:LysR family transcriptional regulator [Nitratireductor aquimarinus]MCA1259476.1 LysR family transcriptional regulator [Nitratireductor aquimarinus]